MKPSNSQFKGKLSKKYLDAQISVFIYLNHQRINKSHMFYDLRIPSIPIQQF